MATFFSDHYTTTGVDQSSLPVLRSDAIPDSSRDHGRLMISRAAVTITTATVGDLIKFVTMKSGDRIHHVSVYVDGGWDASVVMHLGFHEQGDNHDGDLVGSATTLAASIDVASALDAWDAAETYGFGSNPSGEHRGLRIWEVINVQTASTYTVDPNIAFDLTGKVIAANITTVGLCVLEVAYTPQGG
jgi:hypothetical protein